MMRGKLIFSGTPRECLNFFEVSSIEEIYNKQAERTPEEWLRRYKSFYGTTPQAPIETSNTSEGIVPKFRVRAGFNQLSILLRR